MQGLPRLPPTKADLEQHIKRAVLQGYDGSGNDKRPCLTIA